MTIGITGHQEFDNSILPWIKREIMKEIKHLKGEIHAYSSLAIGSDQIFAKIVVKTKIDLTAILPCDHYEQTFDNPDRKEYLSLLSKCQKVDILEFPAPSELAFLSAGKRIVQNSDVLFAIWDGNSAKGLGGTADIVHYALSLGKTIIHLNSSSKTKQVYNAK